MRCPECQIEIEDDSFFCHECGIELLTCSSPGCNFIGVKKCCAHCGGTLVARRSASQRQIHPSSVKKAQSPNRLSDPSIPMPAEPKDSPHQATQRLEIGNRVLRLRVQRTGEVLAIRDGEILGRREGSYAKKLNSLSQYISSKHAQLAYVAGMWLVTDLKSANGTLINKVECVANQATPIRIGDSLELGDLVLEVIG